MIFYKIDYSTSPEIIGRTFPQIQEIANTGGKMLKTKNIWNTPIEKGIPKDFFVPDFKLHGYAKYTDFVSASCAGFGLLFSEKLASIIQRYSTPKMRFFDTHLCKSKKNIKYQYAIFLEKTPMFIDYKASIFFKSYYGDKHGELDISSHEDYEAQKQLIVRPYDIRTEKLVFDTNTIHYDLFRLHGPTFGYFASSRLKEAIEAAGCTGMKFIPLEEVTDSLERRRAIRKAKSTTKK